MSLPPIPDHRRIPSLSNSIESLLRGPQPTVFLDMGQGSRELSLPVHDSEAVRIVAEKQVETANKP